MVSKLQKVRLWRYCTKGLRKSFRFGLVLSVFFFFTALRNTISSTSPTDAACYMSDRGVLLLAPYCNYPHTF